MKYTDILSLNKKLGHSLEHKEVYEVFVLSNITVNQIKEVGEYTLRSNGINAHFSFGDYDNIVQDSGKLLGANAVIIFWELANVIDGLQYRIDLMSESDIDSLIKKLELEIRLTLTNLDKHSLVLFNKFSAVTFDTDSINKSKLSIIADKLNVYLDQFKLPSLFTISINNVFSKKGVENLLELRYFYSNKALYNIEFFRCYMDYIYPFFNWVSGKSKKVIVLDCDNTLWNGVLGEEGLNGIQMSPATPKGAIFREVQSIIKGLYDRGTLICICSKNNFEDTHEVFEKHPDSIIRSEHISINMSNWKDKASNLITIAEDLNIGLESFLFVDDSSFEVNLIKETLSEVTVIQVPSKLENYPSLLKKNLGLFYNPSITVEDMKKSEMYKQQSLREGHQHLYKNNEDYLKSLGLKILPEVGNMGRLARLAQLTQKTNQFNLTTKRYSEQDLLNFLKNTKYLVANFSVTDKFGEYGVTGMAIVKLDSKVAFIDTFLISCRVIGRNIEFKFFQFLLKKLSKKGITKIKAKFIPTRKNSQVSKFYEILGFDLLSNSVESVKEYELYLPSYKIKILDYIVEILD